MGAEFVVPNLFGAENVCVPNSMGAESSRNPSHMCMFLKSVYRVYKECKNTIFIKQLNRK